jgi:hypothetical protein
MNSLDMAKEKFLKQPEESILEKICITLTPLKIKIEGGHFYNIF